MLLRLWTLKLKTNLCNLTYLVAPLMLLISSPSGSATSDWNIHFSATTRKPSAYFYTGFTTLGCTQKTSAVYSGVWNQHNGNRFLGPVPSRTSVYWATSSGAPRCWADLGVRRLSYSFLAVFVLTFVVFIVVDYAFYNFPLRCGPTAIMFDYKKDEATGYLNGLSCLLISRMCF